MISDKNCFQTLDLVAVAVKMPVTGLHKNLEILLEAVISKSTLKSWQVYDERGGVTFKIRFEGVDNGRDSPKISACFSKKPPAKTKRDRLRSQISSNEGRMTRSKAKEDIADKSDIEILRDSDTSGKPSLPDIGHVQSPVSVHSDLDSSVPEHLAGPNPHTPVCSTPLTAMAIHNIDTTQITTEPCVLNQDPSSSSEEEQCINNSHSNHSNSEDISANAIKIDTKISKCHFLGEKRGNHGANLYKAVCMKCNITICYDCLLSGKHSEHCAYIKDG